MASHSLRKMLLAHNVVQVLLSALLPAVVLPAHIYVLWRFWQSYSRYVDKRYCSCSCWDTVYKGPYESGVASYKHMYFNATRNSVKMWLLVVAGVVALYETNKFLLKLLLRRKLRFDMAILFGSSIFSHYYSWWAYLNYYNDDYYSQWNHQFFFTLTEIISTAAVLHLANNDNPVTQRKTLCIIGIALLHILTSGVDQFISNVIHGEGYAHQVVRDLGFMIPDVLHVLFPFLALVRARLDSHSARSFCRDFKLHKDVAAMFFGVVVLFAFCSFL